MLRPWHYSLVLDKESSNSIHQQLIQHFRTMIEGGSWLSGSPLPSSRDIALRLGINRKTVSRVYEELSAQGLIYTQPKRGTFVSELPHLHQTGGVDVQIATASVDAEEANGDSIQQFIQKACVHHIRRAALHMHKLRPQDHDVTGLLTLKHMLANHLAHERRYLVPPEQIACGAWPTLQHALLQSLTLTSDQCLLVDHVVSDELAHTLGKNGFTILRLPDTPVEATRLIEQIEKFCINYPVAALWCDSRRMTDPALTRTEQAWLLQKLSDYELLLIEDQRMQLPTWQDRSPLSASHHNSLLLGSLYGPFCDPFNLSYIASNRPYAQAFTEALDPQHQQSILLNMLAQSELIKRGEYKKLVNTIQRHLKQA